MSESMLRQEIEVYSEKYDIHGVIRDYGVVTKLFFNYGDKEIVMGITRNVLKGEKFEDLGRNIIDSYVSNLAAHEEGQMLKLHYWYINEEVFLDGSCQIAHGIVTGHTRLADSTFINTSEGRASSLGRDSISGERTAL